MGKEQSSNFDDLWGWDPAVLGLQERGGWEGRLNCLCLCDGLLMVGVDQGISWVSCRSSVGLQVERGLFSRASRWLG